ncbi:MAG: V-type ATP synthase subunit F [Candidatus Hydrogenedentes bacterium]|nr:V-type ATP synthase subunit F [Candidatus Hydrogenedentota bacterium]
MKFFVIGDWQAVLGFRLAGVEGVVVTSEAEAATALREAVARKDVGLILVTEKVANSIRDEFDARLYGHGFPLVLDIPDASGPVSGRLTVEDAVRRAVGMNL